MNTDMFAGSEKARIKTLTVGVKKPTEKTTKTTENEDVCKFAKGGGEAFENKKSAEGGPENTQVKKPVEKSAACESIGFTFDDIYSRIMEGADGVGMDTQSADMNLDNGGFDDNGGDLGGDPDLDADENDPEDTVDDDDDDGDANPEDIANLKIAIKYLKKLVRKMGGDPDEEEDDNDDLDDLEVSDDDNGGMDNGGMDNGGMNNGGMGGQQQPPMGGQQQPTQESLQIGAKTNLGPKMSQKANGKLGKKHGSTFHWSGKKYDVSGQAKKMPKSKFGPKMGKTVSNINKGDFIK